MSKYGHCPECAFSAGHAARCSRGPVGREDTPDTAELRASAWKMRDQGYGAASRRMEDAAAELEGLRVQLGIANSQIRELCAESDSQNAEIRALTEKLRKEKGVSATNNDIIRRLAESGGCACGNPAEHGPHND